jgi:hypothetical protein
LEKVWRLATPMPATSSSLSERRTATSLTPASANHP